MADSYIKISSVLVQMSPIDGPLMGKFLGKIAECFEKARKIEGRASSDEDLKLSDTFRYYMKDTSAAKVCSSALLRTLAQTDSILGPFVSPIEVSGEL